MLNETYCTLCLSHNKRTINIFKTDVQCVYENLANITVTYQRSWMCFICHKRLRQCYLLKKLAVKTRGLIENVCENEIDIKFGALESLLNLSTSNTKIISTLPPADCNIKTEPDEKPEINLNDTEIEDEAVETTNSFIDDEQPSSSSYSDSKDLQVVDSDHSQDPLNLERSNTRHEAKELKLIIDKISPSIIEKYVQTKHIEQLEGEGEATYTTEQIKQEIKEEVADEDENNETRNNSNLDLDPKTSSEDEDSLERADLEDNDLQSLSDVPDYRVYLSPEISGKRNKDTTESHILHNDAKSDLSYVSNSPCHEVISVPRNLFKHGPETVSSIPENEIITDPSIPENDCTAPTVLDGSMDSYVGEDTIITHTQKENLEPKKVLHKVIRGRDFCFFCENLVLNFARHLFRQHMYEPDVQRIISYPKNSIERKTKITELRKKGNYIQNSVNVIKPMRKQKYTDYLPCTDCLGFYSKKLLWKHKKKCSGNSNKNVQSEAQNLLLRHLKVDENLKTRVFPRMRADKISLVAKSDMLICAYGSQYLKTHREKQFVNVVSRKMREMAKLLIELKKRKPIIKNFFDALKPEHYDDFVAATKIVGKFDSEKDRFDSPTFAMNITTSIKQCCNLAIMMVLKKQGPYTKIHKGEIETGLKTFIQLIYSNWKFDISSQASTDLNKKKWNKITIISLANDLKLLKAYLQNKSNKAAKKINEGLYTVATYIELLETIYCRVLLLNRRRPGELQRLYLHDYLENDAIQNNEKYEEFDRALTASEQILVKKFKRVVIRGKRGRGVPVLFSEEVQKDIKTLLSVRDKFVSTSNKFLFGNPGSENPTYDYKVLDRLSKQSGAKNPKAISSTRLRKHLATLSQVFSMTENDMEQLAAFMGHTNEVNRKSYRLPDDVYQTVKISKLLLLMEDGKADLYKGKNLNDIELDLNEELEGENDDVLDYDLLDPYISRQSPHDEPQPGSSRIQNPNDSQVSLAEPLNIKKGKKRTLVPWTDAQKKVVTTFFKRHIKNKQPPKRKECEELKDQNPELLMNKDWLKIKVFVQNTYSKT